MDMFLLNRRQFLRVSASLAGAFAFSRLAAHDQPVRFGIITDSHYADRDPQGTRYFRDSLGKTEAAMSFMNEAQVDFVVHLGDFKDQDSQPMEANTLEYLRREEDAFATFKGLRFHVLGNHDVDSISKEQFLKAVENTGIVTGNSYYSFEDKGIHFIVLDACFTSAGVPYDRGNFSWDDAFVPREELNWLVEDLASSSLPTVIFIHQLLDDVDDKPFCVSNAAEVRAALVQSKKVVAVFQGHRHAERYNLIDNIHYCTLPGMVDYEGLENNSFTVVTIAPDGIDMKGYGRAPNRFMK